MTDDHVTDALTSRLRDLGTPPVPDTVRAQHLSRMDAAVPALPRREKRFGRLAVAAAAIVGFFAGSTGLAMAGALPGPAQGVAHDVLSVVQVDVPDHPQNHGKCVSEAAHAHPNDPVAKKAAIDACRTTPPGKSGDAPGRSGATPGRSGDAPGRSGTAGVKDNDPCKGKPPWAGNKTMDPATRTSLQDQRAACADDGDEADEPDDEIDDEQAPAEAPDADKTEEPAESEPAG